MTQKTVKQIMVFGFIKTDNTPYPAIIWGVAIFCLILPNVFLSQFQPAATVGKYWMSKQRKLFSLTTNLLSVKLLQNLLPQSLE